VKVFQYQGNTSLSWKMSGVSGIMSMVASRVGPMAWYLSGLPIPGFFRQVSGS